MFGQSDEERAAEDARHVERLDKMDAQLAAGVETARKKAAARDGDRPPPP